MAKEINGVLYLNKEESQSLIHNLLHPDENALKRRDAFLAECDKLDIYYKDDSTIEVYTDLIDDIKITNILDNTKLMGYNTNRKYSKGEQL